MRPRCAPVERSTASDGKFTPRSRLNPGAPVPNWALNFAGVVSTPKLAPRSAERRKRTLSSSVTASAAYHAVSTSPLAATATREPCTRPASVALDSTAAADHVRPPSVERWNAMSSEPPNSVYVT